MSQKNKIVSFIMAEVAAILVFGGACGILVMPQDGDWTWSQFRQGLLPRVIIGSIVGVVAYFKWKSDAEAETKRLEELEKNRRQIIASAPKARAKTESQKGADLHAIRAYLHHLAIQWWSRQPESMSVATCDACSVESLYRNEGYLIGSYLHCENCYETRAEPLIRKDPNNAGYGTLEKAKEWFKEKN